MRALGKTCRHLFLFTLISLPWLLYIIPMESHETPLTRGNLIAIRERLIDALSGHGDLTQRIVILVLVIVVILLIMGQHVSRRLIRGRRWLAHLYYDPHFTKVLAILVFLLFWGAAFLHWFEMPFSAPPLSPEEVSYFSTNYAHAVWATAVYLLGGIEVSDLRSVGGRVTAMVYLLANALVIAFFVAAYKEKLERRLRRNRLKDKPAALQLHGHLVICGVTRLVKGVLRELERAGYDQDVIIVAPDLDRAAFAGLDRIYDRVWAVRGEPDDEDVIRTVDLDRAAHVLVLLKGEPEPARRAWGRDRCRFDPDVEEHPDDWARALHLWLAVESTNPGIATALYFQGSGAPRVR